ncbi:glycosyltransferase 61 family protein [Mangrovicoccus sp. HB161399]|uniref:glycosyltransferase 61 family protein n=1 Tax=Mangrovicoccus sp. HB161399 TaxID=2720392 RepID=UPI001C131F14|nr:glycosyltransferase 61 family protein [Mangrovicoccus sp. HB161399]
MSGAAPIAEGREARRAALAAALRRPEFMRRFRDIRIEPADSKRGWPAGPDRTRMEADDLALHWVNGSPGRKAPARSERPEQTSDGPLAWCGGVMSHFGHTLAEQFQRVLFTRLAMPEATCVFTLPKGMGEDQVPGYFWGICDWFGLPRDKVRFIRHRPLAARDLCVFRQGEQFQPSGQPASLASYRWCGPLPEYLEALALLQEERGLETGTADTVYVSRSRLDPYSIPLPGESYLVERMQAAGVEVIWPETMSIGAQLAAFARARRLIFAEGSAMHVRQLLGHLPQEITVISRRKGMQLVRDGLEPRCDRLSYIDPVRANVLFSISPSGVSERWRAFAFFDQDLLLDGLAAAGTDLRPGWDAEAYERLQLADLEAWGDAISAQAHPSTYAERLRLMEGSLMGSGLTEYVPLLRRAAERGAEVRAARRRTAAE